MADKVVDSKSELSEVAQLRAELAAMNARMVSAASGNVDETDHYCGDCGARVKNADDRCKAHPGTPMSHGGLNPLTGQRTLLRVG